MSLLSVKDLTIVIQNEDRQKEIVHDVSFSIEKGQILGLVGESGSGKSMTCSSIMHLLPKNAHVTSGSITFEGQDLCKLQDEEMDQIRGDQIAMVYQDALLSLDPLFTIQQQMLEALFAHQKISKEEGILKCVDTLEKMGFTDPYEILKKYPFECSGGQRQRIMIATAILNHPKLLIADEPTTALDVTIQEEILNHLYHLSKSMDMAVLLITHDMGVIAKMCDQVAVMYAGEIVESSNVFTLFDSPQHPYTKALLNSIVSFDHDPNLPLSFIPKSVPQNYDKILGCRFMDRCPYASDLCKNKQKMIHLKDDHEVLCHLATTDKEEVL